MIDYGTINTVRVQGSLDGYVRIITEDAEGDLHDFHIPFSVKHGPDSFYVDLDFENTEYESPDDARGRDQISCPQQLQETANKQKSEIMQKANV